jgi:hypothetical protein
MKGHFSSKAGMWTAGCGKREKGAVAFCDGPFCIKNKVKARRGLIE